MGNDVPPTVDDLIDAKFYAVKVKLHDGPGAKRDCSLPYLGPTCCVQLGLPIKNYVYAGFECTGGQEICAFNGTSAQNITAIIGPYDTEIEAWAGCL